MFVTASRLDFGARSSHRHRRRGPQRDGELGAGRTAGRSATGSALPPRQPGLVARSDRTIAAAAPRRRGDPAGGRRRRRPPRRPLRRSESRAGPRSPRPARRRRSRASPGYPRLQHSQLQPPVAGRRSRCAPLRPRHAVCRRRGSAPPGSRCRAGRRRRSRRCSPRRSADRRRRPHERGVDPGLRGVVRDPDVLRPRVSGQRADVSTCQPTSSR